MIRLVHVHVYYHTTLVNVIASMYNELNATYMYLYMYMYNTCTCNQENVYMYVSLLIFIAPNLCLFNRAKIKSAQTIIANNDTCTVQYIINALYTCTCSIMCTCTMHFNNEYVCYPLPVQVTYLTDKMGGYYFR